MAFLDTEALIIARLQAKLAAASNTARVFAASQMALIDERQQIVPAIYVVFDGYDPTQSVGNGRVQQIEQHWTITVAVRNAYGQVSAEGVRNDAEPLLALVLAALCGWTPGAEFSGMVLAPGGAPVFGEGFGYFPLHFRTRTMVRGSTT